MIRSDAHRIIADLRADIAHRGYAQADPRHLVRLIGDLKVAYFKKPGSRQLQALLPGERPTPAPIEELEVRLCSQRGDKDRGEAGIEEILQTLETQFITQLLPISVPKPKLEIWPPFQGASTDQSVEDAVDRVLARRRELQHA